MENFWQGKRIFVTGANGFLGSHLTKALVKEGNKPFVLIYEENPGSVFDREGLELKTSIVRGDIRDLKLIEGILKENNIDTIFHLAAQAIVDQAVDDPLATFEVNVQGTINILEAAKKVGGVERIIVASSDKAYGHHGELPYREHTHHLKPKYPYEISKACADLISQGYHKTFGMPVCITRATNLYGPGDLKFNRIVPHTIQSLYHNTPPLIRDTSESLRDYLYVEDAVSGYLKLAEAIGKDIVGEAFNFSTNTPMSVGEAIKTISQEMNKSIEPLVVKTKGFEIKHQYASYDKSNTVLNWRPSHTFIEGIRKTIPWYISHFRS